MPWCPNCKMEYREGMTVCTDCKVDLVESLEEAEEVQALEPFMQSEDKNMADKLASFFEYSNLKAEVSFDEENELYVVSVPPKQYNNAKKLYQAFYYVEAMQGQKKPVNVSEESEETDTDTYNELEADDNTEEDEYSDNIPSDDITSYDKDSESTSYVMKEDQYKDLSGTVWIFLLFGIVGIVIVILNIINVLNFINGWLPTTVMGALFLSFIYIALSTNQKAKKVRAEVDSENKLTEEINIWLKQNVTEEFLSTLHDNNVSDEINYIKKTDTIKEMLIKDFGPQNLAYLDRLIDEYYGNTFEQE